MSGLCAAVSLERGPVAPETVRIMAAAAPHRARGGKAEHAEPAAVFVGLGRPPRPEDPSRSGALYRHEATGVVVACDARLDNAPELRRALGTGAPPPAAGEAGLIAAVYLRWGAAGFERLVGDFAFALHDPRRRRLLLARDPMGMRALYYRVEAERVLVATEAKQILALPGVPREPDERMAAAYLVGCFGAMDWTYFRGISQVPPAHVVVLRPGSERARRFWDVDPRREIRYRSEAEYAEHLRELLLQAVRCRVEGGRPAGVFLSGGLDSGAAASAAGWWIEREGVAPALHAYSWDFGPYAQCDERHLSRSVVERFGLPSRDVPVADAGPLAGFPDDPPDLDDPFHGHFQRMIDRGLALAESDGVGPLLTGMRGDLAIGPTDVGYARLFEELRWIELAGELRRHAGATGEALHRVVRRGLLPAVRRRESLRAALAHLAARPGRGANAPVRRGPGASLPPWIDPALRERVRLDELVEAFTDAPAPELDGPFRRRRYEVLFVPMQLRWSVSHERRAARHGLEAVDPWSDRRIAEFCVAVPQQVFDPRQTGDKWLVRRAMEGVMPESFRREAKKTLPTPLFEGGFREAAATVRNLLYNSRAEARGWIDGRPLLDSFEGFLSGGPLAPGLWWALSLEWWLRVVEQENTAEERSRARPRPARQDMYTLQQGASRG